MYVTNLLQELEFHDTNPNAQPVYVDKDGRILRFMLQPGQSIREHNAPDSPFYAVVLQGHGLFSGGDGQEKRVGPHDLLIFAPGENHEVKAQDEPLVFVGFLQGVPGMRPYRIGGELGREP